MRIHAKGREGVVEIGLCFEASQRSLVFLLLLKTCSRFSSFKNLVHPVLSWVLCSFFFLLLEIRFHYVAQPGLQLSSLLPLLPECWYNPV